MKVKDVLSTRTKDVLATVLQFLAVLFVVGAIAMFLLVVAEGFFRLVG